MAIRFLPDGRMLLIQKQGPVRIVDVLANPVQSAVYMDLTLAANGLNFGNERGVLDIAVDPNFPAEPYVYLFYTPATGPNGARARIARFTHLENAGGLTSRGDLSSELILWQDTDTYDSCCHYGGGLDFGPDGNLWLTTGDHFQGSYAASLQHAGGKVHRITKTGSIPPGNPYVDGAGPNVDSIFAYGLRNPFRSRWDLPTGRFHIAEVGGNDHSVAWEDLHVIRYDASSGRFIDNDYGTPADNLVYDGINFGWPTVEGLPPHDDFPGAVIDIPAGEPLFAYKHNGNGASVIGGVVYRGNQFPTEYLGAYFYADFVRNFIRHLRFNPDGTILPNPDPDPISIQNPDSISYSFDPQTPTLIVALDVGPDGALYYVILQDSAFNGGAVRRYVYDGGNTRPTITQFEAAPTAGTSPLTVDFSLSATDLEADSMTYVLVFGDGTTSLPTSLPDGSAVTVPHTYLADGVYQARLEVSDATHTSIATATVQVGTPPEITSLTSVNPRSGSVSNMFRFGDTLTFSGVATDTEDGPLSAPAFSWSIAFVRPQNTHPVLGPVSGITSIEFPIPDQGQGFSGPVFYRITLTVTDASGLSSSASIDVFPEKSNIQFATIPTGIVVQIDGNTAAPAPFVLDTLINYDHTVTVPATVCVDSVEYTFASWSNGHTTPQQIYNVPETDSSLTATYTSGGSCAQPQPEGLVFHLTTDAGLVLNGGTVLQWADQAPAGNALTAGGAPTFMSAAINGRGAVRFDGIDDVLARSGFTGLPVGNAARSVFMVVRYNATSTNGSGWTGFAYGTPASNQAFGLTLTSTGLLGVQGWGSANDFVSNPATAGVGPWLVQGATVSNNTVTQYRNGVSIGAAARTYNTGTTAIRLGEELNGNTNLNMDVAEVLVYNRALTAAELQQITDYFEARYAISAPGGNTPPVVTITAPADGTSVTTAALPITFSGTATDAEDGDLGDSLVWTSSLMGDLGTGAAIQATLSLGTHLITATATDSGLLSGSASISITVTEGTPGTAPPATGLVTHLQADTGLLLNGSTVLGWNDQGPAGNSLTAVGAPTFTAGALNGHGIIHFDGVDDALARSGPTGLPTGSSNRSVFMVVRYNATSTNGSGWAGFAYGTPASNQAFGLALTPTGLLGVQGWGSANDFVSNPATAGVGPWLVQGATVSNNTVTQYRNGVSIGAAARTYNTGTTAIRLGEELNGNTNLNMDVAEVLVYNRALTAAELQQITDYFEARYAISAPGGNTPPVVTITAPADGTSVTTAALPITFSGTATDAEDGDLSEALVWTSSLDGVLGTGQSLAVALSVGTHVITADVTDGGSLQGSTTITVSVMASGGNTPPVVAITAPADGTSVTTADLPITFSGTATDAEDGDLSDSLVWTSSLMGDLGTGATIQATLSLGTHLITATATDSGLLSGSASISITVTEGTPGTAPPATGLVTHLQADTGLLLNGSTVLGWNDQGPAGNSLTAVGAPTFTAGALNGHGIIHFDGVDDALARSGPTGLPTGSSNRSVFMVVRYNATSANGSGWAGFAYGAAASNRAFGLTLTSTGLLGVQGWGSGNDFVSAPPTAGVGPWLVQGATVSNNIVTQYGNGIAIGAAAHTYNTGATAMRLGEELNGNTNLDMDVAEVLVYDRALNATELDLVHDYLRTKFFNPEGNTAPTVEITSPEDGADVALGTPVSLMATAADAEDGDLAAALVWTSSLMGELGTGAAIQATLSLGTHLITATATDSGLLSGSASISVTVTEGSPGTAPPAAGLVTHLRTDAGLLLSGAAVVGWHDQGPAGNSLAAVGAPTFTAGALNGHGVIHFDGVDDALVRGGATGLPSGASDRSVFVLVRYNAANANGSGWVGFAYGAPTSNRTFGLALTPTGLLGVQGWGSANDFVSSPATAGVGSWLVHGATVASSTVTQYLNDVPIGSVAHTYNTGTSAISLGEELNGNKNLDMDVAEVLVYNRALTAVEVQQVIEYFQTRYAYQ